MRYDPADPTWLNRDRFVLSNGHASMLLYAMLHLAEVRRVDEQGRVTKELAVSDGGDQALPAAREPDAGTSGIAHHFWRRNHDRALGTRRGQQRRDGDCQQVAGGELQSPGFEIFDFNVYAMCSDGDLMEGIGGEAASLAGHLKLSNLCWIYDHNHITLDGPANWSFSEDVATRFIGYGWNVTRVADANDLADAGARV